MGEKEEKIALASFLERLLDAFMIGERDIFLYKNQNDKGNGFYERTLSTALGKLNLFVPRDRGGRFKPVILPRLLGRTTESYGDLMASLVVNGFSRNNIMRRFRGF